MSVLNKTLNRYRNGGLTALLFSLYRKINSIFTENKLLKTSQSQEQNAHTSKTISNSIDSRTNGLGRYWFIADNPYGENIKNNDVDRRTINWVLPKTDTSSGGLLTILQLIKELQKTGFQNRIVFESPDTEKHSQDLDGIIKSRIFPTECAVSIGHDSLLPAYFTIATNWTTAYLVKNFQSTIEKCYLSLDYEPYFYPAGTDNYLAARTYDFGFKTFTGGNWLAEKLKSKHNVEPHVFGFACDKSIYNLSPRQNKQQDVFKLFFYARPSTPRRGFELGMLAIKKLLEKYPNVEVLLAGYDLDSSELPARVKNMGVISISELPRLYNNCDAALVISFTNISLLPLDLMSCSCAVISNNGPQVEWLINDDIAQLAEPDPDSLFLAIEKILTNDELRMRKVKAAYNYVSLRDWSTEAKSIAHILQKLIQAQVSV